MGAVWRAVLLSWLVQCVTGDDVRVDNSQAISVAAVADGFDILPGYQLLASVVVWANFSNDQAGNGWMYLEITSNAAFPDQVQAKAAGVAEGYLTRNSMYEYYKEFYTNDLCNDERGEKLCSYIRKQIEQNDVWMKEEIVKKAESSPYWHMVNLFTTQIEGLMVGWKKKTIELDGNLPDDFDNVHGAKLINYYVDVWDYVEKYKAEGLDEEVGKVARPTCSVLIKHLPGQGELYVGHNAWHEYRAMGYR